MGIGAPGTSSAQAWPAPIGLCVGVLGDYAFGSAAMVVETAARVGAKPIFVVVNNEGIAGHMIQDHMLPPDSPRIASLLPARYEKLAEMVDGHAEYVEQPDEIRPALDRALGGRQARRRPRAREPEGDATRRHELPAIANLPCDVADPSSLVPRVTERNPPGSAPTPRRNPRSRLDHLAAGPGLHGAMLGDMGADVIKIEQRGTGDPGAGSWRRRGTDTSDRPNWYFEANNRNKKSITLDLKKPEGLEVVRALAEKADVFVQNFRKGVAGRLGLGYASLSENNPGLIYASATGYGPEGPDSAEPSFDHLGLAQVGHHEGRRRARHAAARRRPAASPIRWARS